MPAPHPVGPAELQIIRECGKKGMGKCETMRRLGWGANSFSTKCVTYPEIERAYYEGKYETLEELRKTGMEVALSGDGPMLRWMLEKLSPEDYGKQTEVKAEVSIEGNITTQELPLDIESMTPEQKAALRVLVTPTED